MGLKEILDRILPEGEIVLERVPSELRQQIWDAKPEDFYRVILKVNLSLVDSGMKPLTQSELGDAEQGNFLRHKR